MRTRIGFVDGLMANKKSWAIGAALFVGALAGKQALWSYVSAEVTTQREREHQRALMELELGALNTIYRVAKKELKEGKILEKKKWH